MDNVTHSLVGVALAETFRRPSESRLSLGFKALALTGILSSNFPDLDLLWVRLSSPGRLGYLLEHRGYSHTFLLLPLLAVVVACLVKSIYRKQERSWSLLIVAALGLLLHILFDACNNYGVHPFSPVWNRWIYGDFIFILEPALWMILLPFAFTVSPWRPLRLFWAAANAGLILFMCLSGYAPWGVALAMSLLNAGAWLFFRRPRRALFAWIGVAVVLLSFVWGAVSTRQRVFAEIAPLIKSERLIDVAMSPNPGNPFCWNLFLVSRGEALANEADQYRARRGAHSLWPALISPESCAFPPLNAEATAPLVESSLPKLNGFVWGGEFRGSVWKLRQLAQQCRGAAILKFLRVPFWFDSSPDATILGDLRYDRRKKLDFSEFEVFPEAKCPRYVPPWAAPRADLLSD